MTTLICDGDFVCRKQTLGNGGGNPSDMSITAPVGATTSGRVLNRVADVRKVQAALNKFPVLDGGPSPQLTVDGICGPLTKDAIVTFQLKFGLTPKSSNTPDGIVDVGGDTADQLQTGPSSIVNGVTEFFERIPDVMRVATAASAALEAAIFQLQFPNRPGQLPGLSQLGQAAVARADHHFHINRTRNPVARLRQVQRIYLGMQTAIGHVPQGLFLAVDEPLESHVRAFAFTEAGGFFIRDPKAVFDGTSLPVNSIYICPRGRTLAPDGFTYMMIHELAHFVGPESPNRPGDPDIGIYDFGAFHKGTIDRLSPDITLRNADSYAQFAFDAIGKPNFNVQLARATT
jgi:hypothetical protein